MKKWIVGGIGVFILLGVIGSFSPSSTSDTGANPNGSWVLMDGDSNVRGTFNLESECQDAASYASKKAVAAYTASGDDDDRQVMEIVQASTCAQR